VLALADRLGASVLTAHDPDSARDLAAGTPTAAGRTDRRKASDRGRPETAQ